MLSPRGLLRQLVSNISSSSSRCVDHLRDFPLNDTTTTALLLRSSYSPLELLATSTSGPVYCRSSLLPLRHDLLIIFLGYLLDGSLASIIIYRGVALGMFLLCRSFVSSNYLLVLVLVVIRLAI